MNRINAADREKQSRLKQKHQELELLQKQKQKQKVNAYKDRVLLIREKKSERLVESVDVLKELVSTLKKHLP
jgi:hypothetical protein